MQKETTEKSKEVSGRDVGTRTLGRSVREFKGASIATPHHRLRRGGHGGRHPLRDRAAHQHHPGGGHHRRPAALRGRARAHGARVAGLWHRRRHHVQPGLVRPCHEPAPRRLCRRAALLVRQHRPVLELVARDPSHHGHHQRAARLHDDHPHGHPLPVPADRGRGHGLHHGRPHGAHLPRHRAAFGLWPLQGRRHRAPDLPLGLPQVRRPQRVHRGERHRHARRQELRAPGLREGEVRARRQGRLRRLHARREDPRAQHADDELRGLRRLCLRHPASAATSSSRAAAP